MSWPSSDFAGLDNFYLFVPRDSDSFLILRISPAQLIKRIHFTISMQKLDLYQRCSQIIFNAGLEKKDKVGQSHLPVLDPCLHILSFMLIFIPWLNMSCAWEQVLFFLIQQYFGTPKNKKKWDKTYLNILGQMYKLQFTL